MVDRFFPYERDGRWKILLAPLGISDDDGVAVSDNTMRATFGYWSVETPLTNVAGTLITGPHRWYTAVGLRLSFSDDGLTFGTNHLRGLCIEFKSKSYASDRAARPLSTVGQRCRPRRSCCGTHLSCTATRAK